MTNNKCPKCEGMGKFLESKFASMFTPCACPAGLLNQLGNPKGAVVMSGHPYYNFVTQRFEFLGFDQVMADNRNKKGTLIFIPDEEG